MKRQSTGKNGSGIGLYIHSCHYHLARLTAAGKRDLSFCWQSEGLRWLNQAWQRGKDGTETSC